MAKKTKPRSASTSTKASAAPPAKKSAATKPNPAGREIVRRSSGKPDGALAQRGIVNFEEDSRAGMEGIGAQDLAIPRLAILQDLSPQVKKTEAGYIEGAEPGDICDVVSGVLYSGEDGILVVPVSYRRAHIEWVPRNKGGGFVADHGSDGKIVEKCQRGEKGELNLPNGNIIKITAEYFVMMVEESTGEASAFVLSMTGTQMKKSRRWNTMMNQLRAPKEGGGTFNPAMFYRSYKLTTTPERNDQGSWFGWVITPDKNTVDYPNGAELYVAARDFRAQVASGAVRASAPVVGEHDAPEESETSPM
jgi:hypothetical protein